MLAKTKEKVMKKTLIMITAIALASSATAQTLVPAGNIVGYTKVNLVSGTSSVSGFTMIGMSFEACDINNQGVEINSPGFAGAFFAGGDSSVADNLMVFDPSKSSGYRNYYCWDGDGLWYDAEADSYPTTDTIDAGEAFWYVHRRSVFTMTIPAPVIQ